jgi:hypothetical protein
MGSPYVDLETCSSFLRLFLQERLHSVLGSVALDPLDTEQVSSGVNEWPWDCDTVLVPC